MRVVEIVATLLLVVAVAYAIAVFGGCSASGSGVGDKLRTESTSDEPRMDL